MASAVLLLMIFILINFFSGGGVGALDESVIIVSPSPKKDPSYIDISDSFQVNSAKTKK